MGFLPEFSTDLGYFSIYELLKIHAQLSFIISGPGFILSNFSNITNSIKCGTPTHS